MTTHPIDALIIDGVNVSKSAFRNELRQYVREFTSVANFRTYDLSNTPDVLIAGVVWKYDSTDFTTADDGTTCILDLSSRRFKKISGSGGSITGETLFRATAIGGSANALTITSNGMGALSATPKLILVIPTSTNTLAVSAVIDGASSIPIVAPSGAALAAGEWLAGVPYLLSVTSTAATIFMSGAQW